MNATDPDAIILQVLGGDLDAYAELVRRYQQDVWKVLAAILLDTRKTEDLVQQTFIQAYQHLNDYQPGRDFGRWIKGIARNMARQEIRRCSREGRRLDLYYNHWLAIADSPTASVREESLASALDECAKRLPPESARLVELRYHRSLDFSQIAETLGRTIEATRQQLARIRVALRDCVEERISRA